MQKVKIFLALFILIVLIGACSSQNNGNSNSQSSEPIKLGLLLPLTGEAASWGQNALAGATLAANEINSQGGIGGRKIELVAEDDKCSADSVSAIQKLINVDQVTGVIGPICSASGGTALPIAESNGVPVVIVAASAPKLTEGEYIFRVYPSDSFQGKEAANFIYNTLGKKKIAIVYVKNDWGEGIKNVFAPTFRQLGGEVIYEDGVLQTDKDFKTLITKVKESGAEALYLPVYPAGGVSALKQIKEMNLNIPVIGGDAFDGEEFFKSDYAEDTIYLVARVNSPEDFKAKIKNVKGFENLEVAIAAPLAYDALRVMTEAIKNTGSTNKAGIKEALKQTSINGVSTSKIEFDSVGDLKQVAYDVKVVRSKKSVYR